MNNNEMVPPETQVKPIKIATSKRIAKTHNAVGCVIFCFGANSEISYASYGSNKHNCNEVGEFAKKTTEKYINGELHQILFKEGPQSPFPKS